MTVAGSITETISNGVSVLGWVCLSTDFYSLWCKSVVFILRNPALKQICFLAPYLSQTVRQLIGAV